MGEFVFALGLRLYDIDIPHLPVSRRLSAVLVSPRVRQHVGSGDGAKKVENTDMTHASIKLALHWMSSDRTPYKRKVSGSSLVTRGFPQSPES